ncbi:hypothetical protein PtrSN002B_009913 [Pyrenophora tritici-repentis]|uniref:Uncharacterized protein n=3 Tax=Pyrenophora tritici-repentis TaxID=45151 RepID=A0A2W1IER3_9PLEO|nr:uncharacterized protein PTRG_01429 [Pyrenophora tritici-repentis Pt-1C-BFP]KAI0608304.1 hypothetical protein TUN205_07451 [Pyrenophora tritici-repentis]EDU40867.1 predicted protein [Pyrenophora tritici-repentis Pt-1C-BFP]KAI1513554.1 hypothetical protein Ptr86124_007456 [Pyrenophora tritici-repentis]KAI1526831.1 hypothetical protein PtrSN001A_009738 [Pyrenophora tritici-repentis]KAI1530100.1 hypothetical protein PtrSN001C_008788 [Pyrenophora tritici-repentis]
MCTATVRHCTNCGMDFTRPPTLCAEAEVSGRRCKADSVDEEGKPKNKHVALRVTCSVACREDQSKKDQHVE